MFGKKFFTANRLMLIGLLLGVLSGFSTSTLLVEVAKYVAELTVKTLQLLSLPILFLSIVSTLAGMKNFDEMKTLGRTVLKYTLLTTVIAASVGLLCYLFINPVSHFSMELPQGSAPVEKAPGYFASILKIFPSDIITPVIQNNVFAVVLIALGLGFSILSLKEEQKEPLHKFFSSLFAAVLNLIRFVIKFMPLGVWAFITIFVSETLSSSSSKHESIFYYTITILLANIVQGVVVLPLLLKFRKISPWRMAKGMFPAINLAFFSKSSNATLPLAMENAIDNVGLSKKISRFSLPLCTTINMNGCAAFILITTIFVATLSGRVFSPTDYILWVFIATFAAIGNAGVPMGCYFLSSAILAGMGVPLEVMGVILPIYTLIDMVETALNVWSDSCVTAIVDKEYQASKIAPTASPITEILPEQD